MKKDDSRRESGSRESSAVNTVSVLMDERRKFEAWIKALDDRRESTPDHVFQRVHADYAARLELVVVQLDEHADGLRGEIDTLSAQLSSLQSDHQKATDERAEAELRAHVGELSVEDWQRMSAESDARLGELASKHGNVEQELARMRQLLDDAARQPSTTAPVESAPAVASPSRPSTETPVAGAAEAELPVPAAPRASGAVVEPVSAPPPPEPRRSRETPEQRQLAIEDTAAPPPAPAPGPTAAPTAPPPAPTASPPHGPPPRQTGFDELTFLRSVVDAPAGPVEAAPRDEPDEATRRSSFARRSSEESIVNLSDESNLPFGAPEEKPRDPASTRRQTPSALDPLTDTAEGNKTLKCGECGSLNYPTEWYCERCGAELASL